MTFLSRAQPTWGMWLVVANGLLVFMERFEYVEFAYKVRDDAGAVVAVGELAAPIEAQSTGIDNRW